MDWNDTGMLEASCRFRLPAKARHMRFAFGKLCMYPDVIRSVRFFSRSHDAVIRVYDDAGNVIGS
jgi:hypothetical protein